MVLVGFALSVIEPARQLSTAPLLVMLPLVAVIVVLPAARQSASPALTDATAGLLDTHVTLPGTRTLPYASMPMGLYWYVAPTGIDSVAGKVKDASGPDRQVRVVLPLTPPLVAVMVETPSSAQLARPVAALMAAPFEDHTTEDSGVV